MPSRSEVRGCNTVFPRLLTIQHFTQGHFSSVLGFDPELSLINHYTSCCFRKKKHKQRRLSVLPVRASPPIRVGLHLNASSFFCSPPTENTFAGWSRMLPFTYRYIYNMHKCNTHTHMAVAFYSETQWMYKVILRSSRWCRSRSTVTQYVTILSVLHVVHAGVNGHMISVALETLLYKHSCCFL